MAAGAPPPLSLWRVSFSVCPNGDGRHRLLEVPLAQHHPPREPQRIAKLLARAGIASRREIERMIEERRIAINGQPVEKPATLLTSLHGVTVDGKPVKEPAPARLFRYHKPAGLLTAASDPQGRPDRKSTRLNSSH